MRQQPRGYARITIYGLNDLISLSDISRIAMAEASDDNVVEKCVIITYTDGYQHVLDTPELRGSRWREYSARLVQLLSEGIVECTSAVVLPLAVADPAKLP